MLQCIVDGAEFPESSLLALQSLINSLLYAADGTWRSFSSGKFWFGYFFHDNLPNSETADQHRGSH